MRVYVSMHSVVGTSEDISVSFSRVDGYWPVDPGERAVHVRASLVFGSSSLFHHTNETTY